MPSFAPRRLSRRRLLATAGGLAAATLGSVTVKAVPSSAATGARELALASGDIDEALAQLDGIVGQLLERTGVPGLAIAVVYQDQVRYLKGFGVREAGKDAPVTADTAFQLASVSKPVATTVVAALVGQEIVDWDDHIVDHDPGFQLFEPWVTSQVTLRDMFAHRSGLADHAGDLLEDIGYDRDQVLYRLRYQKPASSFRSEYAYTNFGFTEAAVAAAKAAGKTWEDVSADVLYRPLGMNSTSSRHADLVAAENRARGHVQVDGAWVAKYDRDPDAQSPAGGVSSTVRDLAQWLRLHLGAGAVDGRQIVASDALGETHRPQIVSNPPHDPAADRAGFYGLGWNVSYDDQGRVRLSHSGGFALGAGTATFLVPAEQLGIIVLTNAAPIGVAEAAALSFLDLALTGQVQKDWLTVLTPTFVALAAQPYDVDMDFTRPPAQPTPALSAGAYTGAYRNDFFGDIQVVNSGNGLVLQLGPQQTAFPLDHFDHDTFVYQPVGENAVGLSGVTFTIGADGNAAKVVIDNLDIHGEGTFARVAAAE